MPTAVRLENVTKSFGAFRALDGVSWQAEAGEIHGLVGMNGSGKSTLVKILAGYHAPDPGGRIWLWDREAALPLTGAERQGIATIHQDLGLADDLSVADNIGLGVNFGFRAPRPIDWRRVATQAEDALRALGLSVPPDTRVLALGRGERTAIALARAMGRLALTQGRFALVLDEPTVAFDRDDVARLFRMMRGVADGGNAVVFISHRLREVLEVSDRVTVIRDGRVVASVIPGDTSPSGLIELMLGRRLESFFPEQPPAPSGPPVLSVSDLSTRRLSGVSFSLLSGEILGVTGLMGMGQDELPATLIGAEPITGGTLRIGDVPVGVWDPATALRRGVGLLPADRHRQGLWLEANGVENLSMPVLGRFFRRGLLDHRGASSWAGALFDRYRVTPADVSRRLAGFSGGNQQKVVMAKTLQDRPRVIILHQPTVGVDAAAKRDILEDVCSAARQGAGVLYVSTEYEELAHLCHRVLVFEGGRLAYEIPRGRVSEQEILERCHAGWPTVHS